MREALEYAAACWPLEWPGRFRLAITEFETKLEVVRNRQSGRRWHLVPLVVLVLMALLANHSGVRALRVEFDKKQFPVDAANFISQHESDSVVRIYASWQWGGYLVYRLWPSISVFDDGRTDFYGPAFVENALHEWDASPDWAMILARNRVNAALLPVDSALATVLRQSRDWNRVYEDRVAVLFIETR